jgi:hypothetical protein
VETRTSASLRARLSAWSQEHGRPANPRAAREAALAYCQLFSDARAMAFPPPRGLRAKAGEPEAHAALLACCRELSTLSQAWEQFRGFDLSDSAGDTEDFFPEPIADGSRKDRAPRRAASMVFQIVSALQPWESASGAHPVAKAAMAELRGALGRSTTALLEDLCAHAQKAPRRRGWSHDEFLTGIQTELFRRREAQAIAGACLDSDRAAPASDPLRL